MQHRANSQEGPSAGFAGPEFLRISILDIFRSTGAEIFRPPRSTSDRSERPAKGSRVAAGVKFSLEETSRWTHRASVAPFPAIRLPGGFAGPGSKKKSHIRTPLPYNART